MTDLNHQIRQLIQNDPVLAAQIKLIANNITMPSLHEEALKPSVTMSLPKNREVSIDLMQVPGIQTDTIDTWVGITVIEHDETLSESEIIRLLYWPIAQLDIAVFRFVTLVTGEGAELAQQWPEAFTHTQVTGEAIVINEPLDEPDEDED